MPTSVGWRLAGCSSPLGTQKRTHSILNFHRPYSAVYWRRKSRQSASDQKAKVTNGKIFLCCPNWSSLSTGPYNSSFWPSLLVSFLAILRFFSFLVVAISVNKFLWFQFFSGKSSLLFQFAFNAATETNRSVVFICNRRKLEHNPPYLSQARPVRPTFLKFAFLFPLFSISLFTSFVYELN